MTHYGRFFIFLIFFFGSHRLFIPIINASRDCQAGSFTRLDRRSTVLIRSKSVFKSFIIGTQGWNIIYVSRESNGGLRPVPFLIIHILIGNGKLHIIHSPAISFVLIYTSIISPGSQIAVRIISKAAGASQCFRTLVKFNRNVFYSLRAEMPCVSIACHRLSQFVTVDAF